MEKERPTNFINMTGVKYGKFTVIEEDKERKTRCKRNRTYWFCQCECGTVRSISGKRLRNGKNQTHCGCSREYKKKELTQEELQLQRCKKIHRGMLVRCHNPNSPDYPAYGAKGILVAPEWHDRDQFIEDMFPSYLLYEEEHGINKATIDRIDNSKGYSKDNCRWLTREAQIQNRTFNRTATINGKFYTSMGALHADYPHLSHHMLIYRHRRGWRDDELVLPPKTNIKTYRAQQENSNNITTP